MHKGRGPKGAARDARSSDRPRNRRQMKLQERIPADPCAAPKGSLPIRCVCARWLRGEALFGTANSVSRWVGLCVRSHRTAVATVAFGGSVLQGPRIYST